MYESLYVRYESYGSSFIAGTLLCSRMVSRQLSKIADDYKVVKDGEKSQV